jgi:hypothetical protein
MYRQGTGVQRTPFEQAEAGAGAGVRMDTRRGKRPMRIMDTPLKRSQHHNQAGTMRRQQTEVGYGTTVILSDAGVIWSFLVPEPKGAHSIRMIRFLSMIVTVSFSVM